MKKIISVVMLLSSICYAEDVSLAQMFAMRYGALAKFSLLVVDDNNVPVPNASIVCGFSLREHQYGGIEVKSRTDENGKCVVEEKTDGHEVEFWVEKDGYYTSKHSVRLTVQNEIHEVRFNRWQPYGEELKILIRKKVHPIECVRVEKVVKLPSKERWYDFDLVKGDLVSPYGEGETSDIRIKVTSDGKPTRENKLIEMYVEFIGKENGFYHENKKPNSEWQYSYLADEKSDFPISSLYSYRKVHEGGWREENTPFKERAFISRIRTIRGDDGNLKECYYLRIINMHMFNDKNGMPKLVLNYRLNLTPNDPNLETL